MVPERHALNQRIEATAQDVFDKKLEDLDESELREVWDLEAMSLPDGRADAHRHARLAPTSRARRRSSSI